MAKPQSWTKKPRKTMQFRADGGIIPRRADGGGGIVDFVKRYLPAGDEDTPVGTAGLFSGPSDAEVQGTKNAIGDWWDWRKRQGFVPTAEDMLNLAPVGIAGTFGGIGSYKAPFNNLVEAQSMLKAGHSPENVWYDTGWAQAPDKSWRHEISDANSRIRPDFDPASLKSFSDVPLKDILDHPELYEHYPQLADMPVRATMFDPFIAGYYNPEKRAFGLNRSTFSAKEGSFMPDARQTLLHEAQHAVQDLEGFAPGTSPAAHRSTELFSNAQGIRDRLKEMGESPEFEKSLREMSDAFDLGPIADYKLAQLYSGEPIRVQDNSGKFPIQRELHPDERKAMQNWIENDPVLTEYLDHVMQNRMIQSSNEAASRIYKENLGEREAREVEARKDMDAFQRREEFPGHLYPVDEPLAYPGWKGFGMGGIIPKQNPLTAQFNSSLIAQKTPDPAIPHLAYGGTGAWYTRSAERGMDTPSGLLHSPLGAAGGRTDTLPHSVMADSFVIPADVVSGLGQGDTFSGSKVLDAMLHTQPFGITAATSHRGMGPPKPPSPYRDQQNGDLLRAYQQGNAYGEAIAPQEEAKGGRTKPKPTEKVPVIVANGEYIVSPEQIRRLGNGDMKRGHEVLRALVKQVRQRTIKELKKLPEPIK